MFDNCIHTVLAARSTRKLTCTYARASAVSSMSCCTFSIDISALTLSRASFPAEKNQWAHINTCCSSYTAHGYLARNLRSKRNTHTPIDSFFRLKIVHRLGASNEIPVHCRLLLHAFALLVEASTMCRRWKMDVDFNVRAKHDLWYQNPAHEGARVNCNLHNDRAHFGCSKSELGTATSKD